ncbi:MAG: hypothetical protein PHP98_10820 [Kiritimatiellae bacterium]|nr:hypothetical protein [Kiritimatiellia bacterium]
MKKEIKKPLVHALGLGLEYYRQTMPDYVRRQAAQFQRFLDEIRPYADFCGSKHCCAQKEVEEAVREAGQKEADALLLIPLCYTASLATVRPVIQSSLPIVIWNTQEASSITDNYSHDDLLMNHVAQGAQDLANVLMRSGKPFGMESGHYRDQAALVKLAEWLHAARAVRFAGKMRVGLLGSPFQDMGDFGVDETAMLCRWGPAVIRLSFTRFIQLIGKADETLLKQKLDEDLKTFDVDSNLPEDIHLLSLRLEEALRMLVKEEDLDAFSMNFRDLIADGRIPAIPFLGINKLLAEGLGYAGEGNVTIAAFMAQLRQLCGAANFTEIYTVDYERNLMVMTHMQECNPALARKDRKIRLVRKDFWAPGVKPYAGMHFTLEPGPVTLCNLTTDRRGDFYIITAETEIMDMPPFRNFDIPHWVVKLREPAGDFLTKYSLAGGTHHLASAPGKHAAAAGKMASLQQWKHIAL